MSSAVLIERRDRVLVVTLNRPQSLNAVDGSVREGLNAAFDTLESDATLDVAVLTGAGGHFCAGADIKRPPGAPSPVDSEGFASFTRRRRSKPVIAAVEGWALGGGFELALACDMIVAARNARFGLPEVTRGLLPVEGGLYRPLHTLGRAVTLELVMTGRPLGAEHALTLGLVNRLTDPGWAVPEAMELAAEIGKNDQTAVRLGRRVVLSALADSERRARDAGDDAWSQFRGHR